MTKIITAPLPHKIGTADIKNAELKRIAMLLMENFKSTDKRLVAVERAINEIQKKGG